MGKLNYKREKFCEQYVICWEGKKAAINAGYSKRTAYAIASNLLRLPEVLERINVLREEVKKENKLDGNELITELKKIGFQDEKNSNKTRALELLLKIEGSLDDKTKHKLEGGIKIDIEYVKARKNAKR